MHQQTIITHHNAPTIEQARYLAELEATAVAKIVTSIRVTDTEFECVLHQTNDEPNQERVIEAIYDLNGSRFTTKHRVALKSYDREKMISGLRDKMAQQIAAVILRKGLMTS